MQNLKPKLILGTFLALVVMLSSFTLGCTTKTPTTTPPVTLSSIAVTPASPDNLAVGSTLQLTATGTYSDGKQANITSQVSWTSANTSVAAVSVTGLATGVAAGTSKITASLSSKTSPAVNLTVSKPVPVLSAITLTPASSGNLTVGATLKINAKAAYSDNSTKDITSQVTWAVSDNTIANISPAGLVTGVAAGTTDITASLSGITSAKLTLTVVPAPTLASIVVTPASPDSLAVGATRQFTATGTYSDNSTADISSQVTWTSTVADVAIISASGLATGVAAGTTEITASLSEITSTAVTLTVT